METLEITWTRVADKKKPCERCKATQAALTEGAGLLDVALSTLGVDVIFEQQEMTSPELKKDSQEANCIVVGSKPMAAWPWNCPSP